MPGDAVTTRPPTSMGQPSAGQPSGGRTSDTEPAAADPDTGRRTGVGARAALVGAAVGGAGLLGVQVAILREPGFLVSRPALLYLTLSWWVLGPLMAVLLLRARPRRLALALLLGTSLAIQAVALTHGPRLSDDLYRYAWDGRVQAAGVDPYRYGPLAPELTHLRDGWLFPNSAGCTAAHPVRHCTRLNYPRAHTIYPPVAQAYFTAVHFLPGPPREHKEQLYASLLSLALVVLLMRTLAAHGRDPRWAAFYALSPLAGLDVGSDAHVDVLGALFAVGALAVLTAHGSRADPRDEHGAGPPSRRRACVAGALLGAAVAVKLYPALLLPAAARRRPAAVLGSAAAVVGLGYLPHVLAVGTGVLGFLPQYLNVEGYGQGSRFLLLAGLGLHGAVAKAVAVVLLAGVTVAVLRTSPQRVPVERAALWLVGAAFLIATPAQPWYGVLLAVLAVLAGRPEWLAVPAAAYVLYISLFTRVPVDPWTLRVSAFAAAALVVAVVSGYRGRSAAHSPQDDGTLRSGTILTLPSQPWQAARGGRPGSRRPVCEASPTGAEAEEERKPVNDSGGADAGAWAFDSAAAGEGIVGPDGHPVDLRTDVAHIARVYDYWLGGKTNYAADRKVAEAVMAAMPAVTESVRANRSFLRRAVRLLAADLGIRQFLDIGTGLPAADNTHEVAQRAAPDARIVYADNDPIVLAHAQALLTGTPEGRTAYVHGDVRRPGEILTKAADVLDFTQPIALMLIAMMHCVPDEDDPFAIVRTLSDAMPPGSYFVLTHPVPAAEAPAGDVPAEELAAAYALMREASTGSFHARPHDQVVRFFDGWELLEPGVVLATKWRADEPESTVISVGVGHKPA